VSVIGKVRPVKVQSPSEGAET